MFFSDGEFWFYRTGVAHQENTSFRIFNDGPQDNIFVKKYVYIGCLFYELNHGDKKLIISKMSKKLSEKKQNFEKRFLSFSGPLFEETNEND